MSEHPPISPATPVTPARTAVQRLLAPLAMENAAPAFWYAPASAARAAQTRQTWAEVSRAAAALALGLRSLGIARGDRVAVMAGSDAHTVTAWLANLMLGTVHVPINTKYTAREAAHIVTDADARCVLAGSAESAAILVETGALDGRVFIAADMPAEPAAQATPWTAWADAVARGEAALAAHAGGGQALDASDLDAPDLDAPDLDALALQGPADDNAEMLVIYTSGTTGTSKGVVHTPGSVVEGIGALTTGWRFSAADTLVLALPLFHVHGLGIGLYGSLLHGMAVDVLPFSAPAVCARLAAGGTVFMGVPTMHRRLIAHLGSAPEDRAAFAQVRLVTSGSAALSAADHARFEALTGQRILERYGMSETLLSLSNPYDGERRAGTVGRPVEGYRVQVKNEDGTETAPGAPGELWVTGPALFQGYLGLPERTAAEFDGPWFRTGDIVTRDPDGYVRIVGRKSADIIKSGGYKIAAREIEEVLRVHPGVADAAVLGLADAEWGQRVAAVVVPSAAGEPGAHEALIAALSAHCEAELANYKRPRAWHIADALRVNALGKVQKHRMRAWFRP